MKWTPGPLAGARYMLRGLSWVGRPGLRRFVAIPVLINGAVFGAILFVALKSATPLAEWLEERTFAPLRFLFWVVFVLGFGLVSMQVFVITATWIGSFMSGGLSWAIVEP